MLLSSSRNLNGICIAFTILGCVKRFIISTSLVHRSFCIAVNCVSFHLHCFIAKKIVTKLNIIIFLTNYKFNNTLYKTSLIHLLHTIIFLLFIYLIYPVSGRLVYEPIILQFQNLQSLRCVHNSNVWV